MFSTLWKLSLLLLTLTSLVSALQIPIPARRQADIAQPLPTTRQEPKEPNLLDPFPHQPLLHFSDTSGSFRLAVITDTHLLDGQENASKLNAQSAFAVRQYLSMEQRDYVVHTGDIVSGEAATSSQDVRLAIEQIFRPIVEAGIPFSSTKGNHDNDRYSTHKIMTEWEKDFAGDLSYTGFSPSGVGGGDVGSDNYWVPVYGDSKAQRGSRPALILWSFDSRSGKSMIPPGGNSSDQIQIEDWPDDSVAPWLTTITNKMAEEWGTPLPPGIIFTHIPIHDFLVAQTEDYEDVLGGVTNETSTNFTSEGRPYPGLNDDHPLASQGHENDEQEYTGQDRPYLEVFFNSSNPAAPSVLGVSPIVSGHDHGADWCAPSSSLEGGTEEEGFAIPLCFAKHSGYGGYDYDNWNHGTRVFEFNLDSVNSSIVTYIRFETGQKRYEVVLDKDFADKGDDDSRKKKRVVR